jgi:hypothetical protein
MPHPLRAVTAMLALALAPIPPIVRRREARAPAQMAAASRLCTAPEHRQFDFWLGNWTVRDPAGQACWREPTSRALHKGCVLFENWTGAGGFTGSSLNVYDAERKKWASDVGRRHRGSAATRRANSPTAGWCSSPLGAGREGNGRRAAHRL